MISVSSAQRLEDRIIQVRKNFFWRNQAVRKMAMKKMSETVSEQETIFSYFPSIAKRLEEN